MNVDTSDLGATMQPEMYLVLYQQQRRELEQRLFHQLPRACCGARVGARRPWWAPVAERLAAFRRAPSLPACCPT